MCGEANCSCAEWSFPANAPVAVPARTLIRRTRLPEHHLTVLAVRTTDGEAPMEVLMEITETKPWHRVGGARAWAQRLERAAQRAKLALARAL